MFRTLAAALALGIVGVAAVSYSAAAAAPPAALTSCSICHDLAGKKKLVGPPLTGVFGRKPSIAGVKFGKWDQAALNSWLTDPSKVKPGTAMTFKVGDAKQRAAVIQALQGLK